MSLESVVFQVARDLDALSLENPQQMMEYATRLQQYCEHRKQLLVALHQSEKVEVIQPEEQPAEEQKEVEDASN